MGTQITFRRGSSFPTAGSGITLSEPVFETTLHTFHIGLGYGVTAEWVGAPISGLSADIAAGITYKIPTAEAVKNYISGLCFGNTAGGGGGGSVSSVSGSGNGILISPTTGAVVVSNTGVHSFNGLTGAVTGVTVGGTNTFTALNSFNSGISSAGGTFTELTRFNSGVSASIIRTHSLSGYGTLSPSFTDGNFRLSQLGGSFTTVYTSGSTDRSITLPDANGTLALTSQLMGSVNGSTASTTAVTSFNGRTGAVTGASLGANTFTELNTFSAGVCASGFTVSGNIRFSGTSSKVISTTQAPLTIVGSCSGPIELATNSIFFGVQSSDSLTLTSTTGVVDISTNSPSTPIQPALRFNTDDQDIIGPGSIKIEPNGYATGNRTQYLQDASGTLALTSQLMGTVNGSTAATTAVTSFNGLTGAVTGVTVGGANTFTALNTFSAGISATGATFSSTTNTLDVIASTEGAGLRIARATSGVGSRIGGIRLGRSTTSSQNTYIEGSAGTFSLYNGVDNTGTRFAAFSPTQFTLGTTLASFITLNSPNLISFGDQGSVGNNQAFSMSGTNRTYTFGDSNGVTAGFVGINRSGLCADYALEINHPTGKGLQLIYNDHTGAASNWVNMDVSSGGNYTLRPSGGLATVTGTLNVSAGISAAGGVTFGGTVASDTGYRITSNAINAQTGTTYTFLSTDNGKIVTFNNGSTTTVTIPASLPVGFNCTAIQLGTGQVGFTAASGVTMNAYASAYKISGQHGAAALVSYTTNIFNLSGTLSV